MTPDLQHKIERIINHNLSADDREVISQLKLLLHETESQYSIDKEAKDIVGLVADNIYRIIEDTGESAYIKTGFDDFDMQFGGFRPGEFVVVGGRPAMGKTQFLINLSLNISTTIPVLYITLDLSESLLTNRFISAVSGIPVNKLLQHNLNEEQIYKLSSIDNEFAKRQLFIHDSYNSSIIALKACCQKQIRENGVQVIIIDYLQLMTSPKHYNRELEVSYISRELKNIAKEHNICMIASCQLNRAVEYRVGLLEKRPQLFDLRESGAIEQNADMVLFINRPEYYKITEDPCAGNSLINRVDIAVAKNKNGPVGDFHLEKDNDFTVFRNVKKEFAFSSDRLQELDTDMPF